MDVHGQVLTTSNLVLDSQRFKVSFKKNIVIVIFDFTPPLQEIFSERDAPGYIPSLRI